MADLADWRQARWSERGVAGPGEKNNQTHLRAWWILRRCSGSKVGGDAKAPFVEVSGPTTVEEGRRVGGSGERDTSQGARETNIPIR